jgi:hypothetical protein
MFMSVWNRHVSLCLGVLVVLAGCSGDDKNGETGASDDASMDSGTPPGDDTLSDAGADGTVATMPGADSSTTPDAVADTGEGDGGEAAAPPADAGGDADGAAVTDGLLLHYAFDDTTGTTVTDTSGGGHDGTFEDHGDAGASAWTSSGRTAGAIVFAGAQDVLVPSGVLASVDSMTIGVWTKFKTIVPFARVFDFGNGPLGTGDHWTFLTPSGINGVEWDMYGGPLPDAAAPEVALLSTSQLPTNVWKHIAMTVSGAEYHMYIDGFPAAETTTGPVITPAEMEPLAPASWLGKSRFPGDPFVNATLDELRVYDHVLSVSEIGDLAWPQHDYSDWRFDEGTGATAADSSDNAITATLSGGAAWTATGRLGAGVDLPGGTWGDAGAGGPQVDFASNPLASCTTAFTVSTWVKIHAQQPWSRIFDFGTASKSAFVYLAPKGANGMHFGMASPAGAPFDIEGSSAVPADNAWHHVAVTVDGNDTVTLYIDGVSVGSGSNAKDSGTYVRGGDFTAVTDYSLGKSRFSDPYLNGALDDLRISCRAYTGDEIKALAHQ